LSLSARLDALGIALIAFSERRLCVSVAEIQLRMAALRLKHFGSLDEFSRFAAVAGLMLSLSGRRLIFPVPVVVWHTHRSRKPYSIDAAMRSTLALLSTGAGP